MDQRGYWMALRCVRSIYTNRKRDPLAWQLAQVMLRVLADPQQNRQSDTATEPERHAQ